MISLASFHSCMFPLIVAGFHSILNAHVISCLPFELSFVFVSKHVYNFLLRLLLSFCNYLCTELAYILASSLANICCVCLFLHFIVVTILSIHMLCSFLEWVLICWLQALLHLVSRFDVAIICLRDFMLFLQLILRSICGLFSTLHSGCFCPVAPLNASTFALSLHAFAFLPAHIL